MSVRVPPAVTHSSSNQPLFTQSPLVSAMRPTQPAREQHQFPAIAAIQGEREPNASLTTRKRPRRSSRGAADDDSESLHVTRVKPEETEEHFEGGPDHRPHHSRSPVMSTNVPAQPQHPPNVKKRRTLLSQIDTEASKTAVDRASSHNSPVSPVVHGFPRGDEPKLHNKTSVHFSHGSGNGTSSNFTGAAPGSSRRTGGHLSSPPVPSAMAAPSLPVLPASPSSFASRRGISTNGPRKKPADLLLGRGTTSMSAPDLRLAVQSAPALPRGNIQPGCFPPIEMPSLPTLPPTLGIPPTVRRVAGQVPPTPNRPQALRTSSSNLSLHAASAHGVGHSPPGVAIASSTIPPTPTALRAPGYTAERTSFLAPFEGFYDALSDAKDLKAWLFENVQKAQTLNSALERQQAQLDETVRVAVERAVTPMRDEIRKLRERVAELDLATSNTSRFPRSGADARPPLRASQSGGSPAEPFTRPSLPSRHPSSPAVSGTESPGPSSAAYDARRQPTSATRFEPRTGGDASRQLIPISALTHGPGSREAYRGSPVTSHFPHHRNDGHDRELPPLSRHSSNYNLQDAGQERSRSRSPPRRREGVPSPGRAAPHSRSPGP